jgi:hypothetical protein
MKYSAHRQILITQFLILLIFLVLTLCNEVLDVPHLLMGDKPTSIGQRSGEVSVEICIFVIVILIEVLVMKKLLRKIKILEGFLPVCANCKKIREENIWKQMEAYITAHSLAKFSHTICPDCREALYPEFDSELE